MRFVIQHHINENEHYDLMIETEDIEALLTWKIIPQDMLSLLKGSAIKAERIQDHRKHYLDYEGPISMGRGSVKIFDSGNCKTFLNRANKLEFELAGRHFTGNILIKKIDGSLFEIQYIEGNTVTTQ